jgi:uncharacterized membrane protein
MATNSGLADGYRTPDEAKTNFRPGIPSRAALAGHPIHPILVAFPIAFLVAAFVTDLLYWRTMNATWAQASYWLLWAGIITAVLAALAGLIDFFSIARVRAHLAGWLHAGLNVSLLVLSILNVWLRRGHAEAAILPWGLVLSALVTFLLMLSGWYGGELIYRYKIAIIGDLREPDERNGDI